jgi:hypothetical protein
VPLANKLQADLNKIVEAAKDAVTAESTTGGLDFASKNKVADTLLWFNSNIDEKHKYILKYYLNPNEKAFIKDSIAGYEGAYLVLKGSSPSAFDMNFNKDVTDETHKLFSPSYVPAGTGQDGNGNGTGTTNGEDSEDGGGSGENFFVMLPEFIGELIKFVKGFAAIGEMGSACNTASEMKSDLENELNSPVGTERDTSKDGLPLDSLLTEVSREMVNANSNDQVVVKVKGLGSDGKIIGRKGNSEIISLEISQDGNNPVLQFGSLAKTTLTNGTATFKLNAAGNKGLANITARSDSGKTAETVSVTGISTDVKMVSYVYFVPEGLTELQKQIAEETALQAAADAAAQAALDAAMQAALDAAGGNNNGENTTGGTGGNTTGGTLGGGSGTTGNGGNGGTGSGANGNGNDTNTNGGNTGGGSTETPGTGPDGNTTGGTTTGGTTDGSTTGTGGSTDTTGQGTNDINQTDLNDTLTDLTKDKEDKDITVLVSNLVEETTLYSTPEEKAAAEAEAKGWEEYYSVTAYYDQFLNGLTTDSTTPTEPAPVWEEEYSIDNYYEQYLTTPSTSMTTTRMIAAVATDVVVRQPVATRVAVVPVEINPFEDAETNPNSPYVIENGDKIVADGKSLMKLSAQIYDSNGNLDSLTSHKVKFTISESDIPNMVTFKNGPIVDSVEGVATLYIKAGTKTGDLDGHFKIHGEVMEDGFPDVDRDLYLVAGAPYVVEVKPDSGILVSNNQSKTKIYFTIKDKFGNIAKNTFAQIGVFMKQNLAYLDPKADNNAEIIGTQLVVMDGVASVDVYAKKSTGTVKVIALLFDSELETAFMAQGSNWKTIDFSKYIGTAKDLKIVDKVALKLALTKNPVSINGTTALSAKLLLADGSVVSSYNGPIKITNLNDKIVRFTTPLPDKMSGGTTDAKNGNATIQMATSALAGDAEILVDLPGFVTDSIKAKVLAGVPSKIELTSNAEGSIYTNSENIVLKASLLDQYDNLIETDNSTPVKFDITPATKDSIRFPEAQTAIALKGVASLAIKGGEISGKANIFAKYDKDTTPDVYTLDPGILSLGVTAHVTSEMAKDFSPRALFMAVLGGAFGDPLIKDNLSQTFLYDTDARVEAITSTTASPVDNQRIFGVDAYGKFSKMMDSLETKIVPAIFSFPYQRIIVSDNVSKKELASIFVIPKSGTRVSVAQTTLPETEGIYVQQLATDDPLLTFTEKIDGVYIERDGETKAIIDKDGMIEISDDAYSLELPDDAVDEFKTKDFALKITMGGNLVGLVTYRQNLGDVQPIPYGRKLAYFAPGIYVQMLSSAKKYDLIKSFSGSSTANAKGLYLIDRTNPLDAAQKPGFPQTSIDKANEAAGVGFEGQNKFMLFFSAGNSVGESNLPYASEVGIVYGDPTVRLKVEGIMGIISEFSGYAKTIGKPVFAGDEKITNMLDFDYNADGYEDILLLYESGLIRLLENQNSRQRYFDRGYILNVYGGAFSATKIDVNNDGYDDLIVGTKESCKKGEECMSLFINNRGSLERQTLNLALEGKAYEMKVGDANADGCDDLFVSDSAGNIRLFYNKNDGDACLGLNTNYNFSKNFGFSIDSNKNTAVSLFAYYPGLEQTFNSLVVNKSKAAVNPDLIQTTAGMEEKAKLENEVQKNSNKFLKLILPSTTPPGPITNDQDPNFTTENNTDPNYDPQKYAAAGAAMQKEALTNTQAREKIVPPQTYPKEYNFIHLTEHPALYTEGNPTTKFAVDLTSQKTNVGDEIQYDVTLVNNSNVKISNMMLSDGTPAAIDLQKDSLKCLDLNCPDKLTWIDTKIQLRSAVIAGISIPAGGNRRIQYKFTINSVPKVHFNVGKDLGVYPDANKKDPYLDILVRPEFKTTAGVLMTHFYSTGVDAQNKVQYTRMDVGPATDKSKLYEDSFAKNGFPLNDLLATATNSAPTPPPNPGPNGNPQRPDDGVFFGTNAEWQTKWYSDPKNQPQIPAELKSGLTKAYTNLVADSNFNGLPNSWDNVNVNAAGQITTPSAPAGVAASVSAPGSNAGNGTAGTSGGDDDIGFGDVMGVIGGLDDALNNALGALSGIANGVANAVEGAMNALRCAGAGCLPIPFNYAFLVPNDVIPGTAIFAWGVPPMMFVAPFWSSMAPSTGGRFYISPTLDGGLAIAICVGPGPGHASPCFAFAIPLGMLGVCPDFMGMISDAIAAAKNAINSATGGMIIASDGSDSGAADSASDSETISGSSAYSEPGNPIQAGASANIRIPGFPAVITDWFDRQIQEVFNKLLDLTDIYFVYPDFGSLGPQFAAAKKNFQNRRGGWNSVHDFLAAVNSLPLITIESKTVTIKIPTIPSNQIEKYKTQVRDWLTYEKQQYERLKFWKCNTNANSYCEKFKADFGAFIKGVESMLDTLDQIANLPYEIMKWKTWESKYATQIICYLDAIMTMIGGYIKKQVKIIEAWMEMVEEIIRTFKSWKAILDLIIDFQVSCDECKNDRFSRLGLLMQLFVAIPSPPIVPLPKWPDLVFDVSQMQLGMKILWPDVVFKPEPIFLPDLPLITVPVIPDINLSLPGWVFKLQLPSLPELPDLPPLPIPKLPDLPRPPKIPALPDIVVTLLAVLKPILKILCLIKTFLPVQEMSLETKVETLTQPNLDVVLMLIASMAIQLPAISYDYVKEIRITASMNVAINVDPIYNIVKGAADVYNNFLKAIITEINKATQFPVQQLIDEAIAKMEEAAAKALQDAVNATFGAISEIGSDDGSGTTTTTTENVQTVNLKNLTTVQRQQLEQALGKEQFDQMMKTFDATRNLSTSPADDSNAVNIKIPTGTAPQKVKEPGITLPAPDANEVPKTEANALLSSAPAMELKRNVDKFNSIITDFVATIPEDTTPEVYYLTATSTYLSPDSPVLKQSIDQLKLNIAKQDLPTTPEMNRMAELRSSMIAYVDNLNTSNSSLLQNLNDNEKFAKILVDNNQTQTVKRIATLSQPAWMDEKNNSYIANNSTPDTSANNSDDYLKMPFFGDSVTKSLDNQSSELNRKLLAANVNPQVSAVTQSKKAGTPMPAPKGLFVIIEGRNENILNYTDELSGKVNMLFTDMDHDGDEDIIYALGGDVYIKENHKKSNDYQEGRLLSVTSKNTIGDYVSVGGDAIQGVSSPFESNKTADISWFPSGKSTTVGYEIALNNSIYDDFEHPDYKYFVTVEAFTSPQSIDLLKKLEITPPTEEEINPKAFELSSPDAPAISVKLPNGNYYAKVVALDKDLNRSLPSSFSITAPSECADKEAPFPAIDTEFKVSIMKDLTVNASNSFDSNGEIVEYSVEPLPYTSSNPTAKVTKLPLSIWSDKSVLFDSNGDGIPWNDKDNPIFKIGPFTNEGDIGVHEFVLNIVDQSGNSSKQNFKVTVFVPDITLDGNISKGPTASGLTAPLVDKMPFSLMRQRFIYRCVGGTLKLVPRLKKVMTPSISANGKYYTDDLGAYKITDLKTKDIITVENSTGTVIAEINPDTGDIGALMRGYSTKANQAVPPTKPTSIDILNSTGNVMGTVYVIADANVDVTLHQNYGFESANYTSLQGVHVDDINTADDFVMKNFPASDPYYPGGAGLVYLKENKYLAFVDTTGNIVIVDPRVTFTQKKNNHEIDPLIFELRFNGTVVEEIYISPAKGGDAGIIIAKKDVPFTTPRAPSNGELYSPAYKTGEKMPTAGSTDSSGNGETIGPALVDGNNGNGLNNGDDPNNKGNINLNEKLDELYRKGILDFDVTNGMPVNLDDAVTRAQFVKIVLDMLCIIPRKPEAYTTYKDGEGFSDMRYEDGKTPWYFPYIREAAMADRQLINGYADLDPVSGLPPFRPDNNITRAEATKIILAALAMQGVIDITKLVHDPAKPWFEAEMIAAVDLTSYLKSTETLINNFILTADEAADPRKNVTFRDLLLMSLRVIDIYNCFIIDSDNNGIPDYYEKKYGVKNPDDDPDKDGLTNIEEFKYGSDPLDADTDKGGATDGQEVKLGTNPLDPVDDPFDNDGDGLTNFAEKLIYLTDPNNPDTDGDCVSDGQEVKDLTDPLDPTEAGKVCDASDGQLAPPYENPDGVTKEAKEGDLGLYIVPPECNTCPCISTFDHKADIVPTDIFFATISNLDDSYFFSKSEEVTVQSVPTNK